MLILGAFITNANHDVAPLTNVVLPASILLGLGLFSLQRSYDACCDWGDGCGCCGDDCSCGDCGDCRGHEHGEGEHRHQH